MQQPALDSEPLLLMFVGNRDITAKPGHVALAEHLFRATWPLSGQTLSVTAVKHITRFAFLLPVSLD